LRRKVKCVGEWCSASNKGEGEEGDARIGKDWRETGFRERVDLRWWVCHLR
jgi:hypothetical protein